MRSMIGDPSVLLWLASAVVALLGARAFAEFLRRLHHEGPIRLWRELLLGAGALCCGIWSALALDISAQGLAFEVGFHPMKVFGALGLDFVLMVLLVGWVTWKPVWWAQLVAAALCTLCLVGLQVAVIWSIGAEPGLTWAAEPLIFSLLLMFFGISASGRMVLGHKRGSGGDRGSRRLLASLVLGACTLAGQELVLTSSGLDRQVVSAHARFLPEVAITLVAGAVIPIGLVLVLVDQRTQQRARASSRRRRRREGEIVGGESMFAESSLAPMPERRQPPTKP